MTGFDKLLGSLSTATKKQHELFLSAISFINKCRNYFNVRFKVFLSLKERNFRHIVKQCCG